MITEKEIIEILEDEIEASRYGVIYGIERTAKIIINKVKNSRKVYDKKYRDSHKKEIEERNKKYRLRSKE